MIDLTHLYKLTIHGVLMKFMEFLELFRKTIFKTSIVVVALQVLPRVLYISANGSMLCYVGLESILF